MYSGQRKFILWLSLQLASLPFVLHQCPKIPMGFKLQLIISNVHHEDRNHCIEYIFTDCQMKYFIFLLNERFELTINKLFLTSFLLFPGL